MVYYILQVEVRHVNEAYKLLNKSIIRVEQPDIYLEDEETDEPNEAPVADETRGEGINNHF